MRAVIESTFWSLSEKPGVKPLPGGAMAVICACGQEGIAGTAGRSQSGRIQVLIQELHAHVESSW